MSTDCGKTKSRCKTRCKVAVVADRPDNPDSADRVVGEAQADRPTRLRKLVPVDRPDRAESVA